MSQDRSQAMAIARQQQADKENRRFAAHARVAERLRAGSGIAPVMESAYAQIAKWRQGALCSRDYIDAWQSVLAEGPSRIAEVLEDRSAFGTRMRQNTPFAYYIDLIG